MLSISTARKLNNQIVDELRTVDSICSSHQEKMEALERITQLKEILEKPSLNPADVTMEPLRSRPGILETIFGMMPSGKTPK